MKYAALVPCLMVAGCFGAARKRPYLEVANTAVSAANDAKTSYQAAQDEYFSEQGDQIAADYAAKGYTPGQVSALIASKDLQARMSAIDLVSEYGTQMNRALQDHKLASNTRMNTSKSSSKSKSKESSPSFSTILSPANAQLMGQAISEIGRILADGELARHLPKAVKAADPHIQVLCDLLGKDIEENIRPEVKETYDSQIVLQDQFIKKNWDSMDAIERRDQIAKLATLEKEQKQADDALAKTTKELQQVAELNHRLATGGK